MRLTSNQPQYIYPTPPSQIPIGFLPQIKNYSEGLKLARPLKNKLIYPTPPPQKQNVEVYVEAKGLKLTRPLKIKRIDQHKCGNCQETYPISRLHLSINQMTCLNCILSQKLFLLANLKPFSNSFSQEFVRVHLRT